MEKTPLELRLSQDDVNRLIAGKSILLTITPAHVAVDRRRRMQETKVDAGSLSADAQRLVDAWNGSDYVLNHPHEGRNKPMTPEEIRESVRLFDKALTTFGLSSLLESIEMYWEACEKGLHLAKGKNLGYSHLGGFLRKLLEAKGNRKKLWWAGGRSTIPDEHPQLTRQVADAYAAKFLGRASYGLRNPSGEYRDFASAADWVELISPKMNLEPKTLIRYLLDSVHLQLQRRNRTASPSWLSSELTWRNDLPQYIKTILGR